jgi:hypothetical protein
MVTVQTIALVAYLLTSGAAAAPESGTREGYVMPAGCKSREEKGGPEAHTTKCALELECVVTGYGLYVDGNFLEFDDEGDQLALKYFRATTKSDHHLVKVVGDFSGPEVRVTSLEPVSP